MNRSTVFKHLLFSMEFGFECKMFSSYSWRCNIHYWLDLKLQRFVMTTKKPQVIAVMQFMTLQTKTPTEIHRKLEPEYTGRWSQYFFKNQLPHLIRLTTKLPPRGLSVAIQMLLICQNLRDCLQSETSINGAKVKKKYWPWSGHCNFEDR